MHARSRGSKGQVFLEVATEPATMGRMSRLLSMLLVALLAGCATAPRPRQRGPSDAGYERRVAATMSLVQKAAERHQVPPDLVLGVIQVESSFRPQARSHAGARGLMQLMPRTAASLARRLGWDDYNVEDPAFNIEAGTAYLAYLLKRFDGDLRLALAGYNAGPARVDRWRVVGRSLPTEVHRYVVTVLKHRDRFTTWSERSGEPLELDQPELDQSELDRPELDQRGLMELVRRKERLYGERPDEPLPPQDSERVTMERGQADPTRRAGASDPPRSAGHVEVGPEPLGTALSIP